MPDIRASLAANGRPLVVAHRGDHSVAPENSIAAVRAARAFDMVEIDVRLSSDDIPVVIHDDTLTRTTMRTEYVRDLPANRLCQLKLEGSAETLPTLDAALDASGDTLLFDIDVKEPVELPSVAKVLARHPARNRCMLKFDVDCQTGLDDLLDLQTTFGITVIAKSKLKDRSQLSLFKAMKDADVTAIELWFASLDLLHEAVSFGVPITTYTLPDVFCAGLDDTRALEDPAAVWGTLAEAGVRAIMTDAPGQAKVFLEQMNEPSSAS